MRTLRIGLLVSLSLWAADARASDINYTSRKIDAKIVYYGPESAGLSENLKYIDTHTKPELKGKLTSLEVETDRTGFCNYVLLSLGEIRGFKTHLHLYTAPGNASHTAARKHILKGVDGVMFVADGDPERVKATVASWEELKTNLAELGFNWKLVPMVVQIDHSDRRGATKPDELRKLLKLEGQPMFQAAPKSGAGVFDSLKALTKLVLMELKRGSENTPSAESSSAPPAAR